MNKIKRTNILQLHVINVFVLSAETFAVVIASTPVSVFNLSGRMDQKVFVFLKFMLNWKKSKRIKHLPGEQKMICVYYQINQNYYVFFSDYLHSFLQWFHIVIQCLKLGNVSIVKQSNEKIIRYLFIIFSHSFRASVILAGLGFSAIMQQQTTK